MPGVPSRSQSKLRSSSEPNAERTQFLELLIDAVAAEVKALGFTTVSGPHGGYSVDISWGSSKWRINVRAGESDDGFRAMIYVNGFPTTEENEALLSEFTAHTDLIEAELHSPHTFNPAAHIGSSSAKIAALATCRWPDYGYQSDAAAAANRLIEFARGVAAAVKAAGH